jgi:hypothetical protein
MCRRWESWPAPAWVLTLLDKGPIPGRTLTDALGNLADFSPAPAVAGPAYTHPR